MAKQRKRYAGNNVVMLLVSLQHSLLGEPGNINRTFHGWCCRFCISRINIAAKFDGTIQFDGLQYCNNWR